MKSYCITSKEKKSSTVVKGTGESDKPVKSKRFNVDKRMAELEKLILESKYNDPTHYSLKDYNPTAEERIYGNKISLKKGEEVAVVDDSGKDLWKVNRLPTKIGKAGPDKYDKGEYEGFVPSEYLVEI